MIIIEAKRWFQKTYGNTYHSCTVYKNGDFVGHVPFTYGYGEQYLQTALEIMQEKGILQKTNDRINGMSKDFYNFIQDLRENRKNYHITCIDVSRKKDL